MIQSHDQSQQSRWAMVRALPIFKDISKNNLSLLIDGAVIKCHGPGERLFTEGQSADYFGYVLEGAYKLTMLTLDGEEVIMHFGVRNEALGIMAVMSEDVRYPFDAVSMTKSCFLAIPRQTFLDHWLYNPLVMMRFQSNLQGRIFRAHDEKRLLRKSLPERMADLLLYLSEDKSTKRGVIELHMTRRDIAAYVGASVESVIRIMSAWTHMGVIASNDRYIIVRDRSTLLAIANGIDLAKQKTGSKIQNQLEIETYVAELSSVWRSTDVCYHSSVQI